MNKFKFIANEKVDEKKATRKKYNRRKVAAAGSYSQAREVLRKFLILKNNKEMELNSQKVREAIATLLGYSPRSLLLTPFNDISMTDLQTDIRSLSYNFNLLQHE